MGEYAPEVEQLESENGWLAGRLSFLEGKSSGAMLKLRGCSKNLRVFLSNSTWPAG